MRKHSEIRPGHAVGRAIVSAAYDILTEARAVLDDPSRSDAVIVHDFRRAMKRWRALLRLLEPLLGREARALRIEARDLARELAGPRDVQSALDALRDIAGVGSSPKRPAARQLKSMTDRLREHRRRMESARLNSGLRARLLAALDSAENSIDRWPLKTTTFDDLLGRLSEAYARARRAMPKDWARASPEKLHTLRQRVIDHRYQMEILEPLWPRMGRAWIREAQRLRTQLGNHQNLVVLARYAGSGQLLGRWRSRLLPAIARRRADHVVSAKLLALRIFAEPPKVFRRRFEALWIAGGGRIARHEE